MRVVPPGGGEVIGSAPDRHVELLSDHDAVHATWSRFGPRRPGADLHVHRRHTDLFYVLQGELLLRLGVQDEAVAVPAGTLARVPPLVVHGFAAGAQELRYLNLHVPGEGFAAYMRALRDGRAASYDQEEPPAHGTRPPAAAQAGGGEVVVDLPGLHAVVLADTDEAGVVEVRTEPAAPGPTPHVHRRHVESLYVLEGELAVRAGSERRWVTAGTWVQVPAAVPHAVAPAGGRPARHLEVHTPGGGLGGFLQALAAGADVARAAARSGFDQDLAPRPR